jgi:short-subunit dehydrogenase
MIDKILADFGKIDVLINNAGIGMRRPFIETTLATIDEMIRTNYLGAVYCAHAALPSMLARRSGHIVSVSSVVGLVPTLNLAGYCASKFALNGWSESLYYELKPLGVHVSIVCPGPVQTDFNRKFRDSVPKSPPNLILSATEVTRVIIRILETRQFEIVLPRQLALISAVRRHAPRLFRRLAELKFRAAEDK